MLDEIKFIDTMEGYEEEQLISVNTNVGPRKLGEFINKLLVDEHVDVADIVLEKNKVGNFMISYFGIKRVGGDK